jgi:hypothetical protein
VKTESIIKAKATDHFRLDIDLEDGSPHKVWKLCFDYRSIAKIEEATGLDIMKIEAWQAISSGKQFPKIVWGGLNRYNPEVTLDEVLDILNPYVQRKLSDIIFDLMFPGVKEAWEKHKADEAVGATADPNVPKATPSV